jgi:predicted RecB family endonuclease
MTMEVESTKKSVRIVVEVTAVDVDLHVTTTVTITHSATIHGVISSRKSNNRSRRVAKKGRQSRQLELIPDVVVEAVEDLFRVVAEAALFRDAPSSENVIF